MYFSLYNITKHNLLKVFRQFAWREYHKGLMHSFQILPGDEYLILEHQSRVGDFAKVRDEFLLPWWDEGSARVGYHVYDKQPSSLQIQWVMHESAK